MIGPGSAPDRTSAVPRGRFKGMHPSPHGLEPPMLPHGILLLLRLRISACADQERVLLSVTDQRGGSLRTKIGGLASGRFAVPAIFTAFQARGPACGSPTPSSSRMAELSMPKAPGLGSGPRFRFTCPRPKRPRAWPKRCHSGRARRILVFVQGGA
jgi:hypothetical protein